MLWLALSACAPKKDATRAVEAPQAPAFAGEVYDCAVQSVSKRAAFRLDFGVETPRNAESLELRFVEVPKLSEAWPPELPTHGLQALFGGGMEESYRFGRGAISSLPPFEGARRWDLEGFNIHKRGASGAAAIAYEAPPLSILQKADHAGLVHAPH